MQGGGDYLLVYWMIPFTSVTHILWVTQFLALIFWLR